MLQFPLPIRPGSRSGLEEIGKPYGVYEDVIRIRRPTGVKSAAVNDFNPEIHLRGPAYVLRRH
jgi:hypothetical protein